MPIYTETSDKLANLWEQFKGMAEQAEWEATWLDGAPKGESEMALRRMSSKMDELEQTMQRALHPGSIYRPVVSTKSFTMNGTEFAYDVGSLEHRELMRALRYGPDAGRVDVDRLPLAPPERLDEINRDMRAKGEDAAKAMTLADDVAGGYLASAEMANDILRLALDFSPVRRLAHVVLTGGTGQNIPVRSGIPAAKRINEQGVRADSGNVTFGLKLVPAHEAYTTVPVSVHLLMDAKYSLDAELADAAARGFAVLEGFEFIKGSGNGEFMGLNAVALPAAQTLTAADNTGHTVTADELLQLIYEKLRPQYLSGATLLLSGVSLSKLRQLKATSGNTYLYAPGIGGARGAIADVPYALCPDLDNIGAAGSAGKPVIYVGDFQQAYAVAVRQDVVVVRDTQTLAEKGQVKFILFERAGGGVVSPDALAVIKAA